MKPKINTPYLTTHSTKKYKTRQLEKIEKIIIHHSATDTGSAEAYARYHVNKRGWPGIGYHYVIEKDGTIKQTNELDTISYHASSHNTNSIGICLTGNFDKQTLEEKQKQSLIELIQHLNKTFKKEFPLIGHRDVASKSCPGDNINIEKVKEWIKSEENNASQYLKDEHGIPIKDYKAGGVVKSEILKVEPGSTIAFQFISGEELSGTYTVLHSLDGEHFVPVNKELVEVNLSVSWNQVTVILLYLKHIKLSVTTDKIVSILIEKIIN